MTSPLPDNMTLKLHGIQYLIPGLCGYCKHGDFSVSQDGWGTCETHLYQHEDPPEARPVVIHATGTCPQFVTDPNRVALSRLGSHNAFRYRKPPNYG